MLESCYKLLGLDMNVTFDEVNIRYQKLVKKNYSDINSGNKEMEEEFKKINMAYQITSSFMQDRCLKYQKISELFSHMIGDMSDEKIIEFVKLIENNINEINEEINLKNSWSKQIDDIVEKIYYNKLQIKKNWDDINQMKKIKKSFYAKKTVLNKELIKRHQII